MLSEWHFRYGANRASPMVVLDHFKYNVTQVHPIEIESLIMIDTNLLVFSHSEPLYCCAYLTETIVACSSQKHLVLWDVGEGRPRSTLAYGQSRDPVYLHVMRNQKDLTIVLQDKTTRVETYSYNPQSHSISKQNKYQLECIGFTKLALCSYQYTPKSVPIKTSRPFFQMIVGTSTIQDRNIETGAIRTSWTVDEAKFSDITFVLSFEFEERRYVLVAQEGLVLKVVEQIEGTHECEISRKLELPSSQQIKIVLWIEPIADMKAIVCLRQEKMVLIDLLTLTIDRRLEAPPCRMLKTIISTNTYGVSTSTELAFLQNSKLSSVSKVNTKLIVDIDVCPDGVFGVTQQGSILFLPL